jgi:hypothetical protein
MDYAICFAKYLQDSSGMDIVGFIKEGEQFRKKEAPPEIRISGSA